MYSKKDNEKKKNVDISKMGIIIDKNEYQEIVLSNSNDPAKSYRKKTDQYFK